MMHWMRKHRKWILWGIVIVVVPSFIAWGGYRGRNRGDGEGVSQILATVGGISITREQYLDSLNAEIRRRTRYGQEASIEDLVADGTAEKLLESMIDAALLRLEAAKIQPKFSREYLVERLKQDPSFQDDEGNFNPTLWNDWVTSDRRQNWNEIYASVAEQVAREMVVKEAMAPARVLDDEVRDEFEKNFTKYQIKFVQVAPEVTPTEDQLQEQYDKDPSKYQTPEQRYIEYAAVSLMPPRPAVLDEILEKARAGEDFAQLAKQYSHHPRAKENGGEVGWYTESDTLPDHLKKAVALEAGEVSDPVEFNGAYYIFKVDEVKPGEESGESSKHIRQVMIRPALTEEERAALQTQAEDFMFKVLETGEFTKTAADAGLEVKTAKEVSEKTTEIEGMPPEDVRSFVEAVKTIPAEGLSGVIDSVRNLYVARVLEVEPPVIRPLEEVRDLVKEDVIAEVKRTPEYGERMEEAAERITDEAETLEQAAELFPDLKLEVKETQPFSKADYLFNQGIMLQTANVIDAVADVAKGEMAGPVFGFGAQAYVFELVEKVLPTEEDWTEIFPQEEKKLREKLLTAKKTALFMDYIAALRDKAATEVPIRRDANAISDALGLNKKPVTAEDEGGSEGAPETAATGEEESAEADTAVSDEQPVEEAVVPADNQSAEQTASPAEN